MFQALWSNIGNIVVGALVVAALLVALMFMQNHKDQGGCSGNCSGCSMSGSCHSNNEKK